MNQSLPRGSPRLYTARRPAPEPGTGRPEYAAAAYRHRQTPRVRQPADRSRQWLPARRPDTESGWCGRLTSPDSSRRTGPRPDAPSRRLPARHRLGSLPARRRGYGIRCTRRRSCRLWCTAGRPWAPWHLFSPTSRAYPRTYRFRG